MTLITNLREEISQCRVIQSEIARHFYYEDELAAQTTGAPRDNQNAMQQGARRVELLLAELERFTIGLMKNG